MSTMHEFDPNYPRLDDTGHITPTHITSGMAWGDRPRRSYAGEQAPPFRGVPEQPKPRMSGGVWQAFGLCVWFYFIGAAVLVEIFRPEWVQIALHFLGVTP